MLLKIFKIVWNISVQSQLFENLTSKKRLKLRNSETDRNLVSDHCSKDDEKMRCNENISKTVWNITVMKLFEILNSDRN